MTGFILSFLTAQMSVVLRKQSFRPLVLINKMKSTIKLLNEIRTSTADNSSLSDCTRAGSLQNSSSLAASKNHLFPSSSPIISASSPSCCALLHPLHFLQTTLRKRQNTALLYWSWQQCSQSPTSARNKPVTLYCFPQPLTKASPSQTLFPPAPCSCPCASPHSIHWLPSQASPAAAG